MDPYLSMFMISAIQGWFTDLVFTRALGYR